MSDLSSVKIEELEGQARSIELRGGGLPHQGAAWTSKVQLVTTWYPGNVEATQQVLGPREGPSKWEGTWRRTQLSRSPCPVVVGGQTFNVVEPYQLRDALEALQRGGARLRVTWAAQATDGTAVSQVREGRISSLEFKHDRVADIMWTAEFEWVSRGATTQKVVSTRDSGAQSAQDALSSELTNFTTALEAQIPMQSTVGVPRSASGFTLGQLEALANAPLALVTAVSRKVLQGVNDLQQLGSIAVSLENEPFAIADAVTNVAQSIVSVGNDFGDAITAQPVEQQSLNDDAASVLRAAQVFGTTVDAQRRMSRAAQDIATKNRAIVTRAPGRAGNSTRQTGALAAGRLLAVHVTKAGDTPQRLSIRYYRSPDHAVDILQANRFPWTTVSFDPGTTLIIPEVPKKRVA